MATGGDKCGGKPAAAGVGGGDLYSVLGVNKECSDADLKVAYRKLAMVRNCASRSSSPLCVYVPCSEKIVVYNLHLRAPVLDRRIIPGITVGFIFSCIPVADFEFGLRSRGWRQS